jgi:hypothetical protein
MDAHPVEYLQYMSRQLQRISSGISRRDLREFQFFHSMNKRMIMEFFISNFEFISTHSIDEIAQFIKIALFIMFEKYMINQSIRNAIGTQLFQILYHAISSDSSEDESRDFMLNIKSPCFNLLCLLYSKISAQMRPKTQEEYLQVKHAFIDIVNSLIPDIHYLMTEKYPAGCDKRQFFFGRNPDQFETLGLFQKLFFEITSHEFKTVIFLEKNRIHMGTIQIFFEEIHSTLQKM